MSDKSKNVPSRIRTFARDLQAERKKTGHDAPAPKKVVTNNTKPTPEKIIPTKVPKKKVIKKEPLIVVPKPTTKKKPVRKEPLIVVPKKPTKAATSISHKPKSSINEATATKIPAFHELTKNTNKNEEEILINKKSKSDKKKKKNSKEKQEDSETTPKVNIGYDATVITDTKSNRFELFPSIITSVTSWFKSVAAKHKRKSIPKYSVRETNRRKGVIQKATSKTGTMFSADNDTIKEQIRLRRKHTQEDDESDIETSWSPYTETGYDLLEAPDSTQNATVEYKKQPVIIEPSQKHTLEEAASPVPTVQPTETPTPTPEEDDETIESINELHWTASHDNFKQDTYQESDLPATVNTVDKLPKPSHRSRADYNAPGFLKSDTNTMTVAIIVIVICTVVVIFSTRIVIQQLQLKNDTSVVNTSTEPVLQNTELSNIILTTADINKLPELINSSIESAPAGLIELPIVSPAGAEVSPSYIFELLNLNTLPTLRQSITIARFTTINRSTPVLVLQFVDIDTVRGGLLNWEQTMANDMSILYDTPTDIEIKFTDEQIDEFDVRVLRYEEEVVLMYGIVNDNTALISPNTATFSQITQLSLDN